jgi:parvulin-like peptidyl-prolyl isomerase
VFTVIKTFSCTLAAIALVLSACGLFDQPDQKVVISVGPRKITVKELKTDLRRAAFEAGVTVEGQEQLFEALVQQVLDHYLILEYGREQGIKVTDEELETALREIRRDYSDQEFRETLHQGDIDFNQWKISLREQLLIRKIAVKVSDKVEPVSFQEVSKYYESNREEFRHPAMVRFRQIVMNTKEEAEEMLRQVSRGEGMEKLAEKQSTLGVEGREGVWIARGDLDESMEKALFSLPVGKISAVVETPYGFHILQVLERRTEGIRSLAEAMKEIEAKLFYEKESLFHARWLKDLRESTPFTINHDILKSMELGK